MRTSRCTIRPVVRAQGPEWTVYCDGAYLDQFPTLGDARRGALGASADTGVYKTVLQVLDLSAIPVATETVTSTATTPGASAQPRQPPREPGSKQREYPHSSGDRNTWPPARKPDKGTSGGGRQRVAPTDLPRAAPPRGGAG